MEHNTDSIKRHGPTTIDNSAARLIAQNGVASEPEGRAEADQMRPFPAESIRLWPISTRVNKPENDDPSIIEPIVLTAA
jgi:hypothetical protein